MLLFATLNKMRETFLELWKGMVSFSNFNQHANSLAIELILIQEHLNFLLWVRVVLLAFFVDDGELGGEICSLRVAYFGKFPGCVVGYPCPIVVAWTHAEVKAMVLDSDF